MKKAILITIGAIVFFAATLFIRLGMYKDVTFETQDRAELPTLFVPHVGPYYKIAEKITFIEKWAKDNGIKCEQTFGEYLDDPKTVDEDRLRSRGGCLVGSELTERSQLPGDASYGSIPAGKYLVGKFDGAPSVGPYKVYPKAFEWMELNKYEIAGPIIEIYNVINEKEVLTEYLFPIKPTQ